MSKETIERISRTINELTSLHQIFLPSRNEDSFLLSSFDKFKRARYTGSTTVLTAAVELECFKSILESNSERDYIPTENILDRLSIKDIASLIAKGCNLDPDAISPKAAENGHEIPEWMFFTEAAKFVIDGIYKENKISQIDTILSDEEKALLKKLLEKFPKSFDIEKYLFDDEKTWWGPFKHDGCEKPDWVLDDTLVCLAWNPIQFQTSQTWKFAIKRAKPANTRDWKNATAFCIYTSQEEFEKIYLPHFSNEDKTLVELMFKFCPAVGA